MSPYTSKATEYLDQVERLMPGGMPEGAPDAALRVLAAHDALDVADVLGLDAAPAPQRLTLDDGRTCWRRADGRFTTMYLSYCYSCHRNSLPAGRVGGMCDWCLSRPDVRSHLETVGGGFRVICSCGWTLDVDGDRLTAHRARADHEAAQHPGYYNARGAASHARTYAARHPLNPEVRRAANRRQRAAGAARTAEVADRVAQMYAEGVGWPQIAQAVDRSPWTLPKLLRRAGALALALAAERHERDLRRSRQGVAA